MHARYPRKYNEDGSINPKWHPRKSGKMKSDFNRGEFVAWDGEGINYGTPQNGAQPHKYVYLCNSKNAALYSLSGLSTTECFDLLLAASKSYPHAIHVIFGGSYDINNMLRDIPKSKLENVCAGEGENPVTWGQYAIRYTPRKCLFVGHYRHKSTRFVTDNKGKFKPDYDSSIVLWDVIGFFQCSFIEAIEKWLGKDYKDYQLIAEGKSQRYNFANVSVEYMQLYNHAELDALVELMQRLQQALISLDLTITRWDGAGSVAAAMCRKHNVREAFGRRDVSGKFLRLQLPPSVNEACEHSYFGGRIEMIQFGTYQDKVYHYDINSAYPNIQRTLPALSCGKWRYVTKPDITVIHAFSVIHVQWDTPYAVICPFPYRSLMQNKILYPEQGEGWYWYPEVKAALTVASTYAYARMWKIKLIEAYEFIPSDDCYFPYSFIEGYYNARQRLVILTKKDGIPRGEEKVLKLGLNALYGKTAQHTGFKASEGNIPTYHNLAYAGYITSGTRAMLFMAASANPKSIIALATDGIFSTSQLDVSLSNIKEIGKWELKLHDSIIMGQSGFYWLLDGKNWSAWSRGFDKVTGDGKTAIARQKSYNRKLKKQVDKVRRAWREGDTFTFFECTRFITLKSALISDLWFSRWCTWFSIGTDSYLKGEQPEIGRKLELSPMGTKRSMSSSKLTDYQKAADSLILTIPTQNHTPNVLSNKYVLPWTIPEIEIKEIDGVDVQIVDNEHMDSYI